MNVMRVRALSILLLAALSLSAFGLIPLLAPIAGFARHQLAELQSERKIEALGSPILAEAKRRLVSDAAERLREIFNRGACEQIYRDAAVGSFRLGPEQQWTEQCQPLRIRIGPWRSFSAQEAVHCSTDDSVVCVDGTALFESGPHFTLHGSGMAEIPNYGRWLWAIQHSEC
jgi:hypothetical protein